jgi:hypothetical protein
MKYFTLKTKIRHNTTDKIGEVIEVNDRFGWILVRYSDGHKKEYQANDELALKRVILPMTAEELADYYLESENNGITDYWRDA